MRVAVGTCERCGAFACASCRPTPEGVCLACKAREAKPLAETFSATLTVRDVTRDAWRLINLRFGPLTLWATLNLLLLAGAIELVARSSSPSSEFVLEMGGLAVERGLALGIAALATGVFPRWRVQRTATLIRTVVPQALLAGVWQLGLTTVSTSGYVLATAFGLPLALMVFDLWTLGAIGGERRAARRAVRRAARGWWRLLILSWAASCLRAVVGTIAAFMFGESVAVWPKDGPNFTPMILLATAVIFVATSVWSWSVSISAYFALRNSDPNRREPTPPTRVEARSA
jgi:hypothetical protein